MGHSTKQQNLYHYYFTLLSHILTDIIPSYYLPIIPSEIKIDATYTPPSGIKTGVLSSNHVFTRDLISSKAPT